MDFREVLGKQRGNEGIRRAKAKLEQLEVQAKEFRMKWIAETDFASLTKELSKWSMKNRYEYLNKSEELDAHRNSPFFGQLKYFYKFKHSKLNGQSNR